MSGYPRDWGHRDVDAAVAALGATSRLAPGPSVVPGRLVQALFTVEGYPAQLSEWQESRRHWIEAEFTVPPTWPRFTLIRSHSTDTTPASSGEITDRWYRLADIAGCELWTPDAHTPELFDRGLAELVARHPLERLRIGGPSASFRSAEGARLNRATAQWTVDLIRTTLIGAPAYTSLGLIDVAPGVAWTREHLSRNLGINPGDPEQPG